MNRKLNVPQTNLSPYSPPSTSFGTCFRKENMNGMFILISLWTTIKKKWGNPWSLFLFSFIAWLNSQLNYWQLSPHLRSLSVDGPWSTAERNSKESSVKLCGPPVSWSRPQAADRQPRRRRKRTKYYTTFEEDDLFFHHPHPIPLPLASFSSSPVPVSSSSCRRRAAYAEKISSRSSTTSLPETISEIQFQVSNSSMCNFFKSIFPGVSSSSLPPQVGFPKTFYAGAPRV